LTERTGLIGNLRAEYRACAKPWLRWPGECRS
jgi:hypothetical protein